MEIVRKRDFGLDDMRTGGVSGAWDEAEDAEEHVEGVGERRPSSSGVGQGLRQGDEKGRMVNLLLSDRIWVIPRSSRV